MAKAALWIDKKKIWMKRQKNNNNERLQNMLQGCKIQLHEWNLGMNIIDDKKRKHFDARIINWWKGEKSHEAIK